MSVYKKDAATNQYTFAYSIDFTSSTGHPYALTGAIKDKIVVASGNKVFVYNRT